MEWVLLIMAEYFKYYGLILQVVKEGFCHSNSYLEENTTVI